MCSCHSGLEMSWIEKERVRNLISQGTCYSAETMNYCFNYVTHGHVNYLKDNTSEIEFKAGLLEQFDRHFEPVDNLHLIDLLERCKHLRKVFREGEFRINGMRVIYK